jgi:hypothetical protein
LQFKYPRLAPDGESVERVETQQDRIIRVHILSPKSREVYFEVSKYELLKAASEYHRHKEHLSEQFQTAEITEMKETLCGSLPAHEYTFEWRQGTPTVILVDGACHKLSYSLQALLFCKPANLIIYRGGLNLP